MAGELRMVAKVLVVSCAHAAFLCAQQQVPPSRPGWPCVAGRAIDPTYIRTAEATGGQVFLFDRSEAGRSMILMQYSGKHEDTIFRSTGTLSTGSHEFTFPVDSTIESLMVTVTLQCLQSITVLRPTNTEVHAGEPAVNDNRFRSGQVLILTRPQAGAWRVRIAGAGIDVFPVEPPPKNDPLFELDNVILTPHALAWTAGLMRANGIEACGNMRAIVRGELPGGIVNREVIERPGFQKKLERYRS